jgi:hypothetical protein
MNFFKSDNWFKEAQSAKEQALSLLGDKNKLQEVKQLLSRTNKPFKHYSYVSYLMSKNTPINSINQIINEVENLFNENKISNIISNQRQITVVDAKGNKYNSDNLIKFQEILHSIESSYKKLVETNVESLEELKDKLVYEGNNITIYKADGPGDCITLGEGQSFCISRRDTQNAYYTYRNDYKSTFYFVYDRNFKETDPLSLVVIDVQSDKIELTDKSNNTGTIDKHNSDTNSYLEYLKSKGIPVDSLVNKPLSEEEIMENKKLGKKNTDLNWFKELTREEKYKYISRYHSLTKEQLEEIKSDKELFNKYLSTGNPLDSEGVKSLNNSQLSIYRHAREKIVEHEASEIILSDRYLFGVEILSEIDIDVILMNCVYSGHLEDFKYILDNYNEELNYHDIIGSLDLACSLGYLNIVKYIIDIYLHNNEPIYSSKSILNSCLNNSVYGKSLNVVKYILETYPNEITEDNVNECLNITRDFNSIEIQKELLEFLRQKTYSKYKTSANWFRNLA